MRTKPLRPVIVIDTREQRAFAFDPAYVDTVVGTLKTGDYSLAGHEGEVAIERKSLDDYIASITRERERFERELARMANYRLRAVVIEDSLGHVHDHHYTSMADPAAVFGSSCCLAVDYSVPILFCETRGIACKVTERLIRRYAENLERAAKAAIAMELTT